MPQSVFCSSLFAEIPRIIPSPPVAGGSYNLEVQRDVGRGIQCFLYPNLFSINSEPSNFTSYRVTPGNGLIQLGEFFYMGSDSNLAVLNFTSLQKPQVAATLWLYLAVMVLWAMQMLPERICAKLKMQSALQTTPSISMCCVSVKRCKCLSWTPW